MEQATSTDVQEVITLFVKAVWEVDQKKLDRLSLTDRITTLGIDSVAMMEVIGYLEEELDIHLPDEKLQAVDTMGDLARVIVAVRATS